MTAEIALTSRMRVPHDVVFRDLEGELVLLNLKTGVYFGLDPMGTRIWYLIDEKQSLRHVRDALLNEFEVAEDRCEADLLKFVRALQENRLVEVDDGSAA